MTDRYTIHLHKTQKTLRAKQHPTLLDSDESKYLHRQFRACKYATESFAGTAGQRLFQSPGDARPKKPPPKYTQGWNSSEKRNSWLLIFLSCGKLCETLKWSPNVEFAIHMLNFHVLILNLFRNVCCPVYNSNIYLTYSFRFLWKILQKTKNIPAETTSQSTAFISMSNWGMRDHKTCTLYIDKL